MYVLSFKRFSGMGLGKMAALAWKKHLHTSKVLQW